MERGATEGNGGEELNAGGAGTEPAGEADDGAQNAEPAETDNAEPEQGEGTDPAAGSETGEAEESAEGDGGEAPAAEGGDALEQLNAKVTMLEAQLKAKAGAAQAQEPPPAPMTDEQWADVEEKWGGMPRAQIQQITGQSLRLRDMMMAEVDRRMARFEKTLVMDDMAKDPRFSNIRAYQSDMDEYLGNFEPAQHSKRDLLTHAFYYAKGKNADKQVKAAVKSKEVNKRIAGIARPQSGSQGASRAVVKLNPMERQAARAAGMSEQEYAKFRKK